MKKMLGLLMSMTIVSAGTASVVSCGALSKTISTYFNDSANKLNATDFVMWDKETNSYKEDAEAFKAWQAKSAAEQKAAISVGLNGRTGAFNKLRLDISNVLTYSGRETTLQKLKEHKKIFKGADENTSVDGIYDKALSANPQEYYGNFQNTQVSSLIGLYQLQKFVDQGEVDQATADKASGNNLAVVANNKEFFKALASEGEYASKNGSFTKIEYAFDAANADNQIAYLKNGEEIGTEDSKLAVEKYLSKDTNIYELSDDAANKAKGQTGNAAYDPFAQKVISSDSIVKAEVFKEAEFIKKEKTDQFRKEYLTVTSDKKDDFKFEYVSTKNEKTGQYTYSVNNKLSYITAETSLKIKYVYNTDIELKTGEEKGKSYTIEAQVDGIRAVYCPSVAGVKVEKDADPKTQFGWVLVGYQFNEDKDSQVTENGQSLETANKKTGAITYHDKFKNFKVSNLSVAEGDNIK